jgi:uncharacterized protein (TIGR03437 family)
MIRSLASQALLLLVLVLFFCGARVTAFAETWEPVSTGFATDITISTSGGNTVAEVRLTCPNTGYRVTDWGVVARSGNEFSADAKVERWTGVSAQMIITITHTYSLGALAPGTYSFAVKAYGSVVKSQQFTIGSPAPAGPRLLTEDNTERAVALESVTLLRGPFSFAGARQFSSDKATRVMLFAADVELGPDQSASAVTALAEDSQQRAYPLTVEYCGKDPDHAWLTQVILKLPEDVVGAGDIWVSINVGAVASNKVLISIKPPIN